jgi:D-alanyl-D-alanine carboxypeptidase (penicillin-binding protein 5/6)
MEKCYFNENHKKADADMVRRDHPRKKKGKIGREFLFILMCALLLLFGIYAMPGLAIVYGKEEVDSLFAEADVYGMDDYHRLLMEAAASGNEEKLRLYSTAAVLMDADSGRVLYGVNEDSVLAMASTTKIMTCILVLENGHLEDMAEVSSYAAGMPQVKMGVRTKESYRVEDLLYALMLESQNDAAVVLAEYIGKAYLPEDLRNIDTGDYTQAQSKEAVAAFTALMNQKALEIGCENTWFITPNGLDGEEIVTTNTGEVVAKTHSTTAADLARIMTYCIKESPQKEAFLTITRTPSYYFTGGNGRSFSFVNHNAFLNMMEGALTGKTGFTNKAGYCYVGALEREGKTLVVALLACGWPNHKTYKWSDTRALMQYGLDNFTYHKFEEAAYREADLPEITVENGRPTYLGGTATTGLCIPSRDDTSEADGASEAEGASEADGTMKPDDTSKPDDASEPDDVTKTEGILLKKGEKIQVICKLKESLSAPVAEGELAGMIYYVVDGKAYKTEQIVTTTGIEAIDFPWCFRQTIKRFLQERRNFGMIPESERRDV